MTYSIFASHRPAQGYAFLEATICLVMLTSMALMLLGIGDYLITYLDLRAVVATTSRELTNTQPTQLSLNSDLVTRFTREVDRAHRAYNFSSYSYSLILHDSGGRSHILAVKERDPSSLTLPPQRYPFVAMYLRVSPRFASIFFPFLSSLVFSIEAPLSDNPL
jgi:hypothetical protein